MLRIAICDDNSHDLQVTAALTAEYLSARALQAEVCTFTHPDALLCSSKKHPFDLYLLDVVLPMISGIDLGRELRRDQVSAQIIYLTSSDDFAVEAFSVRAVHYLVKPISRVPFAEGMDRALAQRSVKRMAIRLEGGAVCEADLDEILYIESAGHLQRVCCKTRVLNETRRSLSRLAEELETISPGQFISPYKGYLLNLQAVRRIDSERILLRSGDSVPLVKRGFRQVRDAYFDFCFRGNNAF